MAVNCPLCTAEKEGSPWFKLVECKNCNQPMIVATKHRSAFTSEEKEAIKKMFPYRKKRWKQNKLPQHAHCHLLPNEEN